MSMSEETQTGNDGLSPSSVAPIGPKARTDHPFRNVTFLLAASFVALLVGAAIFAPLFAPQNPEAQNLSSLFQGPGVSHLLGTDELGRDLLSRLIYGGRESLLGVGEALGVYLLIGMVLGLIAGYLGGIIDDVVVWIANLSFAVPQIIVILAILAIFSNDSSAAMFVLGILGGPGLAVFVRGAVRAVKEEQFVAAAKVAGLNRLQIIRRHVLPMIVGPVTVQVSLFAGIALIFQTGLDYLGIGTQPPTPSWGGMVAEASGFLARDPWMVVPAGVIVTLTIVSFGLIGDTVRDWYSGRSEVSLASATTTLATPSATSENGFSGHQSNSASDSQMNANLLLASATESEPMLKVSNITVSVMKPSGHRTPVVEGISFRLEAGESLGIVGESGSGKTVTALALIGLLPQGLSVTSGEIKLGGTVMSGSDDQEIRRLRGSTISMISQEPTASLDPSFSVGAQVIEVLRRHGRGSRNDARREMLELLELVKLPDPVSVAKKYPHELSGGMAQRVSIATALAGRPKLLIADEPTTALDVTVQAEILALLRELREKSGLAMILVSHDFGVIADSCDRAVVMYAGQVVEMADVRTLFDSPRHPYTRGLLSSNPHYANAPHSPLESIPGAVPRLGTWPIGCHFASRCSLSTAECQSGPIPVVRVIDTHVARCIHTDASARLSNEVGGPRA